MNFLTAMTLDTIFDYKNFFWLTLKVTGDILLHYLNKCIKHITGDNFLFCKTAHFSVNHMSNTVKVVGRERSTSFHYGLLLNSPAVNPTGYEI